jgi:CubicO group peptidase (beta-lactamase class C family)
MTSTLIGIAIDKDFLPDVDIRVVDLLQEYARDIADPRFGEVKLRHLMCMSSGLEWNEQVSYNDPRNSEWQMVESEDWIRFVLSRPVFNDPGTRFLYNTGGMHLLSAVIKSATGLTADRFAETHLFHPMGIYAYQWNRDILGFPSTGGVDGGLGLRTRDLAKIGWLFINRGSWNGKRIVSEAWVNEVTTKSPRLPGSNAHYAFNWFSGTGTVGGIRYEYIASFGYGGQVLYLVPEHRLLVVITCELADGGGVSQVLLRKILEAAID